MPYPSDHAARTRRRILKSAQDLFHRESFANVSVRDVMRAAGLTHGSFYRYFRSKGELYAEVVALAFDFETVEAPQVIRAYLSRRHLENIGRQCPLIALPTDVARGDRAVKRAFATVFRSMVRCFARDCRGRSRDQDALAIAGMCVGSMVVARALDDPGLERELRESTLVAALRIGGWLGNASRERRRHARVDSTPSDGSSLSP